VKADAPLLSAFAAGALAAAAVYPLTEKEFGRQVDDYATLCGWLFYRTWLPIHSPAGFPDRFLVRNGAAVALELKSEKGKATDAQLEWIAALNAVPGIVARVVKPSDWPWIEAALR